MPLRKLIHVFTILNNEKIRYCHWKSNSHLSKSFESLTDFDLLVAVGDVDRFQTCMKKFGMKRRYSTANKVYPGIEDFLGFDEASGNMFHLHVHFKLVIGKKNQKNYHIPIEELVLESSIRDESYPIQIIRPELELMLLILRAMLKVDLGIKLVKNMIRGKGIFPANVIEEFVFLKKRIDQEIFLDSVVNLFPELIHLFEDIAQRDLSRLPLLEALKFQKRIIKSLKRFRLFSDQELKRETKIKQLSGKDTRSWLPTGGVSFAFVGADGSGKSSTVDHISKWLKWKLSALSVYMGLPKYHHLWKIATSLIRIVRRLNSQYLKDHLGSFRCVLAAKIRSKNYQYSDMLKNQGKIIIFDRFPLKEFWEMDEPMDGPRLTDSSRWKDIERQIYDEIKYPDYIFVLKVNGKAAIERKKEHRNVGKQQAIKKKIKAIEELVKTNDNRFFFIDTSKGQEKTLLEIKRKIWGVL